MTMNQGQPGVGSTIVTGAAGFIGSHLCEALRAEGRRVVGIDNFDPFYDATLKRANVREIERAQGGSFELVEADIRDADAMRALFEREKPASVIHIAARAGVRPSIEDPVGYSDFNVLGTSVVLDAAARAGAGRMLVASSSSVYGNAKTVPFSEEERQLDPISPYAATKLACEAICHAHAHLTGMPTACLRFFTVYGPRQRPDLAIRKFMRLVARGEAIEMYGNGSTSRDYTFVSDLVRGILAAEAAAGRFGYRVWNLGSDAPVTLDGLIAAIGRATGIEPRIVQSEQRPGDVERTWADLSRAREELGYAPEVSLEEGLSRQWDWMRAQGEG